MAKPNETQDTPEIEKPVDVPVDPPKQRLADLQAEIVKTGAVTMEQAAEIAKIKTQLKGL